MNLRRWFPGVGLVLCLFLAGCEALSMPFANEFDNPVDPIVNKQTTDAMSLPKAPQGLVTTSSDGLVVLNWEPVSGADGYRVWYAEGPSVATTDVALNSAKIVNTTATIDGLKNGSTYAFIVVAYNSKGDGAVSDIAKAIPKAGVPDAPTGLRATAGNGQVVVSWDAVAGATGYKVYYAKGATATIADSAVEAGKIKGTTATVDGLTNGTAYAFVVVAYNTKGDGTASAAVAATPKPSVPDAPLGLKATAGDGQVVLNWDSVAGADSYKVYYAAGTTATTADTQVASSSVVGTQATVKNLINKTTYAFIVVATNMSGSGAASAVATRAAGVYTLTYDSNGATSGNVPAAATSYGYGTSVTVLGNTASMAKTSMQFIGWNTRPDGSGTACTAGTTLLIENSTTLYAIWRSFTSFQWTAASTLPSSHTWSVVTWGGDRFVAVSNETTNAYSAYSTDGKNWTTSASAVFASGMSFLSYGNGVFVATNWTEYGATPTAAWSNDGLTWTSVTLPQGSGKGLFLAFGGGYFVITAFNPQTTTGGYYSTDGKTWSPGVLGYSDDCWGLAYGDGTFVTPIFGESRVLASTTHGTSWVSHAITLPKSPVGIAYGNGVWMVRDDGAWNSAGSTMKWSTDLVTWSLPTSGPSLGYGDFVVGNGIILSNGSNTTPALYSLNGKDWATVNSAFTNNLGACAYGNGIWVALSGGQAYWSQ